MPRTVSVDCAIRYVITVILIAILAVLQMQMIEPI